MKTIFLKSAIETEKTAAEIAQKIKAPAVIFLEGQLGAGKTTFVKGFLQGCGYAGPVKSPTFTLIELYQLPELIILHADLYRIQDETELSAIGFRDYFDENTILLIEWASRAPTYLPKPDMICTLHHLKDDEGRKLEIQGTV